MRFESSLSSLVPMFAPPFISSSIAGSLEPAMSYRPVRPLALASPLTLTLAEFGTDSTEAFLTGSVFSSFKLLTILAFAASKSFTFGSLILSEVVPIESF